MSSSTAKKPVRVRPVSREPRFQKIRSLRCFHEVHRRLVDGWSTDRVATFIQQEAKEYLDVRHESLRVMLGEYRQTIPPHERAAPILPSQARVAEAVKDGLDELRELEQLYAMQMERIKIDFQNENTIKKLMPSMTQEMRAAREILSDIAQIKMDLGLNKRHLGTVDVDAQVTAVAASYSPGVGKVIGNPESRRKLLGIAERFVALTEGSLSVKDDEEEDGELVAVSDDDDEAEAPESEVLEAEGDGAP